MVPLLWSGAVASAAVLLTPAPAAAVTLRSASAADTMPPAAVVASFKPGGRAYQAVADAASVAPDGKFDAGEERALDGVTFGMPHRYVSFEVQPSVRGTGPTFVADDFGTGSWWITVESRDGAPFGDVITDADGSRVEVGSSVAEAEMDALPAGAIVLADGHFGDVFAVSADLRTATPLEEGAVRLVGSKPVDAPTYRAAKAREAADEARAAETMPPGAVDGVPHVIEDGPPAGWGGGSVAVVVVLAIGIAGTLIARVRYAVAARRRGSAAAHADLT